MVGPRIQRDGAIDDRHVLAEVRGAGDLHVVDGDPGGGDAVLPVALAVDNMEQKRLADIRRDGDGVGVLVRRPARAQVLFRAEDLLVGGGERGDDKTDPRQHEQEQNHTESHEQRSPPWCHHGLSIRDGCGVLKSVRIHIDLAVVPQEYEGASNNEIMTAPCGAKERDERDLTGYTSHERAPS